MTWWAWLILGAVLFGAELIAIDAQFYLVFLGLSAALVGAAGALGIALPEWIQWLAFAALALISMVTFRKSLYQKIHGNVPGFRDSLVGESLVLPDGLDVGRTTRASLRGSTWTVVNSGENAVASGERVRVTRNEGLTLYVDNNPGDNPANNQENHS